MFGITWALFVVSRLFKLGLTYHERNIWGGDRATHRNTGKAKELVLIGADWGSSGDLGAGSQAASFSSAGGWKEIEWLSVVLF